MIREGIFGPKELATLVDSLEKEDVYLLCYDFDSYVKAHELSDQVYQDKNHWQKMAV